MTTLEDVHEVYKDKLYLEDFDFIDNALATYITKEMEGEPLWLFPIKPSGFGASTQLYPFIKLSEQFMDYRILLLDQATSKAFNSASKDKTSIDLGSMMQNNYTMILIPDFASIAAGDDAEATFAMMRTLYDGYCIRHTGQASHVYKNIKVNTFAVSTPAVRHNIEFATQMGTREFVYNIPKVQKPMGMLDFPATNKDKEELYKVVKSFIDSHRDISFEWPTGFDTTALKYVAYNTCVWRVEPTTNDKGILVDNIEMEYIARVYKQLQTLVIGLHAMGVDQPTINRKLLAMENGAGNMLRREVYEILKDEKDGLTITQISNKVNRAVESIMEQMVTLRELGFVMPVVKDDYAKSLYTAQGVRWVRVK